MDRSSAQKGQPGRKPALLVGCAAGLLAALIAWLVPSMDLAALDARFRLRGVQESSGHVLLVSIDDVGLESLGDWSGYARIISGLKKMGARVMVTDIIFKHADEHAEAMIRATREGGPVVHPVGFSYFDPGDWPEEGAVTEAHEAVPGSIRQRAYPGELEPGTGPLAVDRVLAPHPSLLAASAGVGHIGIVEDPDGVFRRYPLIASLDGKPFPSVPLEAVRLFSSVESSAVSWTGSSIELRQPDGDVIRVPTNSAGQMLLNYLGKWEDKVFAWELADDLLVDLEETRPDPELASRVQGKICLLGAAGSGTSDLADTPFETKAPRMLGIATAIDQILSGRFLREPGPWLAWVLCLLVGLAVALQAAGKSVASLVLSGTAGLILVPVSSGLFFVMSGLVLPTAGPTLAVLLALGGGVGLRLVTAERARREVVAAFGRYLSPAVLDKVMQQGMGIVLKGERKTLTILFSDIVSFSSYCDRVEPEEVRRLLNEYLEEMVDCVFAHEGTVDKFIGDGLLAFFGDPLDQADHATRGVRAALDMLDRVERLNTKWKSKGLHTIQIRIGVNTGPVVVGNVGSARRLEYTVLGNHVNRAQRLEAACKPGNLLMGEQTYERIKETVPGAERIGEVPGKRDERILAWELAGRKSGCAQPAR